MKLETQKHIARNLRTLRTSHCISQTEMASLAGVTRASYASYELGNRLPDAEVLFEISNRFGIGMNALFEPDTYNFLSQLERSEFYDDRLAELVSKYKSLSAFAKGMLFERVTWLTELDKMIASNRKAFEENLSKMFGR
mgnify:FL=1